MLNLYVFIYSTKTHTHTQSYLCKIAVDNCIYKLSLVKLNSSLCSSSWTTIVDTHSPEAAKILEWYYVSILFKQHFNLFLQKIMTSIKNMFLNAYLHPGICMFLIPGYKPSSSKTISNKLLDQTIKKQNLLC